MITDGSSQLEDDAHDDFYLRISSAYGELIYALRKFLSLRCCASPRASCAGRNNSAGRIVDITVPMAENVVRAVKKTQNRLKIPFDCTVTRVRAWRSRCRTVLLSADHAAVSLPQVFAQAF